MDAIGCGLGYCEEVKLFCSRVSGAGERQEYIFTEDRESDKRRNEVLTKADPGVKRENAARYSAKRRKRGEAEM